RRIRFHNSSPLRRALSPPTAINLSTAGSSAISASLALTIILKSKRPQSYLHVPASITYQVRFTKPKTTSFRLNKTPAPFTIYIFTKPKVQVQFHHLASEPIISTAQPSTYILRIH
ncbi:hypothetical protein N7517_011112, partial [Penicillium concentricum]